ncbi:hypothetical protein L0E83_12900 [Marichromatium gracile]|uniref:hypothetical protein n=1 Tax=Marichromatium gracile TaxID=1048 RepID=UPI001F253B42|nr:hypothetical protein [Marichromatium gracile]MCF1184326.1 hypothetical protein [Marichromatium gracile]
MNRKDAKGTKEINKDSGMKPFERPAFTLHSGATMAPRSHPIKSTLCAWRLCGSNSLAAGGWRLAAGNWRLVAGSWRLAAGGWRLAAGGWRLEIV